MKSKDLLEIAETRGVIYLIVYMAMISNRKGDVVRSWTC